MEKIVCFSSPRAVDSTRCPAFSGYPLIPNAIYQRLSPLEWYEPFGEIEQLRAELEEELGCYVMIYKRFGPLIPWETQLVVYIEEARLTPGKRAILHEVNEAARRLGINFQAFQKPLKIRKRPLEHPCAHCDPPDEEDAELPDDVNPDDIPFEQPKASRYRPLPCALCLYTQYYGNTALRYFTVMHGKTVIDSNTVKLYDTVKRYNTVLHESSHRMRIIAIANQKGGVGKTPTTVNIAFALARAGYKILLVDLDPQGSLSEYFLADQADIQDITIYNALSDLQRIEPLTITTQIALLPAHDELAGAELELPSKVHGQKRLAKVLSFYQTDYDFCLLDCPPSLGILTINALASSHQVVIPVKTEISAERALKRIKNTIKDIQESDLNGQLTIWGILPTIYDSRKAHHKEVLQALRYKYGEEVYPEPSRETTKYNDATVLKTDVSTLDKALAVYWDALAATLLEGRRVQ